MLSSVRNFRLQSNVTVPSCISKQWPELLLVCILITIWCCQCFVFGLASGHVPCSCFNLQFRNDRWYWTVFTCLFARCMATSVRLCTSWSWVVSSLALSFNMEASFLDYLYLPANPKNSVDHHKITCWDCVEFSLLRENWHLVNIESPFLPMAWSKVLIFSTLISLKTVLQCSFNRPSVHYVRFTPFHSGGSWHKR